MTEQERKYYEAKRRALIMELGAIEDILGEPRSITPRKDRQPSKAMFNPSDINEAEVKAIIRSTDRA